MRDNQGDIGDQFKKIGKGVIIYPWAKIIKPEVIEIGDYSAIDDFTFIYGGKGIRIGRYVHISSFTSIIGGGELILEDYVGLSAGVRIITGTERYEGGKRMSAALPYSQRNLVLGCVIMEKDAFIGTNAVIHPNVRIGEGAIIGANSFVNKDVEPWSINIGSPCKKIGSRPRVTVEDI